MKTRWPMIAAAALAVGVVAGLAAPKIWSARQSLNECLIEHMKGLPGPMFTTVFEYCQDQQKAEMSDKQVGLR